MKRVRAVILDMDGLMIDTESIYKRSWQKAAEELGYALEDESCLTFIGQPLPACEKALFNRFGRNFPMGHVHSRWVELWRSEVDTAGIPIKPGLFDLLELITGYQLPVAVATSSDKNFANFSLWAAGLQDRFQLIVTGDEIKKGKPAPDIYLESARRLGVEPGCCVAIEDSDAGVLAAASAGMVTMMVPDLKEPSPQSRAAAFYVARSLIEVRDQIASMLTEKDLKSR